MIVAGRLTKAQDGALRLGRYRIAVKSSGQLKRWIGREIEVQGKQREAYRFVTEPPLEVGAVRPLDLLEAVRRKLTDLDDRDALASRRLGRWLRRSGGQGLAALYRIAQEQDGPAKKARGWLETLGVSQGVYMETRIATRALTDKEPVALAFHLVRLDPEARIAEWPKESIAYEIKQAAMTRRNNLRLPKIQWQPEAKALDPAAVLQIENILDVLKSWHMERGSFRINLQVPVHVNEQPVRFSSGNIHMRLLGAFGPGPEPAEIDRQRALLDRLGAADWIKRKRALEELEMAADPAYLDLERAIDDADPQIAAAARRLRAWYSDATVTYLGISYSVTRAGVVVTALLLGSPADRAGLLPGDRIVKLDDTNLRGTTDQNLLRRQIEDHRPGQQVALSIERGKNTLEIVATLGRIESGVSGFYGATPRGRPRGIPREFE